MCLLVLAWRTHPRYQLIVAANRDEFHERAAAPLALWPPPHDLLGGRDLKAGGAWLAVDRQRRFGVVTNFRELQAPRPGAPSRGELIPDYLSGAADAQGFFATLRPKAPLYSGFNLLLSDAHSLWYGSNRGTPFARELPPGVYGLSNESLDTPWPKLQRVRTGFEELVLQEEPPPAGLLQLLADRTQAKPVVVPSATTVLPDDWERAVSAPFVLH